MKNLTWFFDFISPFAYLQFESFKEKLPQDVNIEYCPVLFAGFLKHWENKGPAEIPSKRIFTYRYVSWLARRKNVTLNMPAIHPFNPLVLLRLALFLNCEESAIREIFYFVWRDGKSVDSATDIDCLFQKLNVNKEDITSSIVKEKLYSNGKRAIDLGVFGVPTFICDNQIFWGHDSTEMLVDYINSPQMFLDDNSIANIPVGDIKNRPR
ncbi:DsbA family protein [Candidatus Uabimicrobium sp. HlEnr_7]|uniref:DsbA family protein n=1 Tax=Candidatus Uabimicrobium helgolandensis TaxID=3095367 RepID=UPI00355899B1